MSTLYILCGPPGSGKTTLSKQLAKQHNAKLYCFDDIPGAHSVTKHKTVRAQMHKDISHDLQSGLDIVCDDLNTKLEWREGILSAISNVECKKILYVITTSLEECLKRNSNRNARLPDFVVTDIYKSFQIPTLDEGWDEIIYI